MASAQRQRTKVPASLWLGLAAVLVAAGLVVGLLPLLAPDRGGTPPVWLLLFAGLAIAGLVAPVLYLGITSKLKLPVRVGIYAIAYHALLILVKFVLAPLGLYETNREVDITGFLNVTDPMGAIAATLIVFALYALVYWLLFRLVRRRVLHLPPFDAPGSKRPRRKIAIAVVVAALLLAAISGMAVLVLPLIVVGSAAEYLQFVFTSGLSLLVALAISGAAILVGLTFDTAADRALAVRDASAFIAVFWVGLAFIALYHVLWVVFILVLTATWPLKVVVPK